MDSTRLAGVRAVECPLRVTDHPLPLSLARCGCCTTHGGHPTRRRAVQGGAIACHQAPRAAHHQRQQVSLFLQQVRDRTPHPQVWHPPQSAQIKPNTRGTSGDTVKTTCSTSIVTQIRNNVAFYLFVSYKVHILYTRSIYINGNVMQICDISSQPYLHIYKYLILSS